MLKMLRKRGYNVSEDQINESAELFIDKYGVHPSRSDMLMLVEKESSLEEKMFVFFPDEEKVRFSTSSLV